jgi:hypothetical protein
VALLVAPSQGKSSVQSTANIPCFAGMDPGCLLTLLWTFLVTLLSAHILVDILADILAAVILAEILVSLKGNIFWFDATITSHDEDLR